MQKASMQRRCAVPSLSASARLDEPTWQRTDWRAEPSRRTSLLRARGLLLRAAAGGAPKRVVHCGAAPAQTGERIAHADWSCEVVLGRKGLRFYRAGRRLERRVR